MLTNSAQSALVDAHVHIYHCYELAKFLDGARQNLLSTASQLGLDERFTGVLMLSESAKHNRFSELAVLASVGGSIKGRNYNDGEWLFRRTEESFSLLIESDILNLIVVSGRQIVTSEGLEVLALATEKKFQDGISLKQTLYTIADNGVVPVLAWGVGKWLGQRGKLVNKFLSQDHGFQYFLGDNGNRPVLWPEPRLFESARKRGCRILPGSDPLPLKSEMVRAGRFGFRLIGQVSRSTPAADLRQLIYDSATKIQGFGALESMPRFFRNQLMMRIFKNCHARTVGR